MLLQEVEKQLNEGFPRREHVHISFYRGRGDTLPRGFGGSTTKAITSQVIPLTHGIAC
jgi:phosphoenolpyruvate carboxylase